MQFFTMASVYYKTDTSESVEVFFAPKGKIDFSLLGRAFNVNPMSIQLNGSWIPLEGLESRILWTQIEKSFRESGMPVGTKENPVMLAGVAQVRAVSPGMLSAHTYS